MARPRKQKITLPNVEAGKAKVEQFKQEVLTPGGAKLAATRLEAAMETPQMQRAVKRAQQMEPKGDTLKSIIFDQLSPDSVLVKVTTPAHVSITTRKVADSPLEYLRFRTGPGNQIDDLQYEAGRRYLTDYQATLQGGSNTEAIITHLQNGPKVDKHELKARNLAFAMGTDYELMRSGVECKPVKDPSDKMLAAAWRKRRIDEKLQPLERAVLQRLIFDEQTIGRLATSFAVSPEAIRFLVQVALWSLARTYEEVDAEFAAWVAIERERRGEARG